jgi:hypothetical protein
MSSTACQKAQKQSQRRVVDGLQHLLARQPEVSAAGAADGLDDARGAQHQFTDDDVHAAVALGDHLEPQLL